MPPTYDQDDFPVPFPLPVFVPGPGDVGPQGPQGPQGSPGVGAEYPEVAVHADLPVVVGAPPIGAIYVVTSGSGIWLINRKEAGLWRRVSATGSLADWERLGAWVELARDDNLVLVDGTDPSKAVRFQLDLVAAGEERELTVPDNDGTLMLVNDPASGVSYDNTAYPTLDNVKLALDYLLYVAPDITALTGGSSNEVGSTVTTVNLDWTINKDVTSQSFNQGIGAIDPSLRSLDLTGLSLTTTTAYTLTVGDGTNTDSQSTTVAFYRRRYWGVSTLTALNDAEIIALTSEFSTTRLQTRTFDCTGGRYFYLIYPASFGAATFKVGGLAFTDMDLLVRDFTNASGSTASYYIYRVNNIQTGAAIEVQVL